MTIREILTEAFNKIAEEHNVILHDVSFDVHVYNKTVQNNTKYHVCEIEIKGVTK